MSDAPNCYTALCAGRWISSLPVCDRLHAVCWTGFSVSEMGTVSVSFLEDGGSGSLRNTDGYLPNNTD